MNELAVVDKGADWRWLKALVLDSVSSPITKRVYKLGLDRLHRAKTWMRNALKWSSEPQTDLVEALLLQAKEWLEPI